MRRQIPGKEWAASDGSNNACPCAAFPVGGVLSLPIVAALAIYLFIGTTTAWAAETENPGRTAQQEAGLKRGSSGFAYPVSTANRRFIDQTGNYGSSSAEQFDKVYNQAGAAIYPVVDIEPPIYERTTL